MAYQQRRSVRQKLSIPVLLGHEDGRQITIATLLDISDSGARLKVDPDIVVPEHFRLVLSPGGRVHRSCQTIWRKDTAIGVTFVETMPIKPPANGADADARAAATKTVRRRPMR